MTMHTLPGVGSPAEAEEYAGSSTSIVPANRPPRLENAKAFDNSTFRLERIQEASDATRLLRTAVEHSGLGTGVIAGAAGVSRNTLSYAKKGKFDTTIGSYLRIISAAGARLYVAIPRKKS